MISVIHYPEYGGPHNQLARLDGPLRHSGVQMLVVMPTGEGQQRLTSSGVEVVGCNLGRLRAVTNFAVQVRMAIRFPIDLWQLASIFRRYRPDIVQLSSLVNPHAAYVARVMGISVVWQIVDTRPPRVLKKFMMWQIRYLADVIMPIGQQVADAHPGADSFGSRSVLFLPPVDLKEFSPEAPSNLRQELGLAPNAPLVAVVGNINPQKGHEYFIVAASAVLASVPDAVFVIAGHIYPNHTGYFEQLKSQAANAGLTLGTNLYFLGARLDVANVMRAADVFALASVPNSEGTPTVILEAMACGVPVVATDVGSVSEVVADSHTGYVVPTLDSNTMADRIVSLLANPQLRKQFGQESRRSAESRFGLEQYADTHVQAYQIAIQHARSRRWPLRKR